MTIGRLVVWVASEQAGTDRMGIAAVAEIGAVSSLLLTARRR